MALTKFQFDICRLIARNRLESGESYVAGGTALNAVIGGARISRDIDLFHDTQEAVNSSWDNDRSLLESSGYIVRALRERPGFVEAHVAVGKDSAILEWAADSAFRFFPLVEHPDFGLILHPFDMATNKVLALVGRLEVRDWIDVISCHEHIQQLGYLAWAACGKDPGFSPYSIIEQAGRSSRYSVAEIATLDFAGEPPDAGVLSRKWHLCLDEANELISELPPDESGKCVLDFRGNLYRDDATGLRSDLKSGDVRFHKGTLRGALPRVRE